MTECRVYIRGRGSVKDSVKVLQSFFFVYKNFLGIDHVIRLEQISWHGCMKN